MTISKNFYLNS